MASPSLLEISTAIAAVVSAVGGAFAAVAAFRSADSAREAARSAEDSNRRARLREVSSTAASILVAVLGIKSRASELIIEYKSAEVFSGSGGHSSLQNLKQNILELQTKAESFLADSRLYANGATQLAKSPEEDIDRIWVRLSDNLQVLQTIRDELDRKYTAMAAQNLQHREIALQSRGPK
ncbi:MAG: hypothetical protein Q7U49_02335 [Rhodoferax sp.]|nr:hypothetical protein [Rhodoferax sp.]